MDMEYEITQVITYFVEAESRREALKKWDNHPKTRVTEWKDGDIELSDEEIQVNEY